MNDTITIPRALLEALVDPERKAYLGDGYGCYHCGYLALDSQPETHDADCPIRRAQELLAVGKIT